MFHTEKDTILKVGLEVSTWFTVDDTGARHRGDNWVTTHIGNDLFAWFQTTDSKSLRNFLEPILHAGVLGWRVNAAAVEWWQETGLSATASAALTTSPRFGVHKGPRDAPIPLSSLIGYRFRPGRIPDTFPAHGGTSGRQRGRGRNHD